MLEEMERKQKEQEEEEKMKQVCKSFRKHCNHWGGSMLAKTCQWEIDLKFLLMNVQLAKKFTNKKKNCWHIVCTCSIHGVEDRHPLPVS